MNAVATTVPYNVDDPLQSNKYSGYAKHSADSIEYVHSCATRSSASLIDRTVFDFNETLTSLSPAISSLSIHTDSMYLLT